MSQQQSKRDDVDRRRQPLAVRVGTWITAELHPSQAASDYFVTLLARGFLFVLLTLGLALLALALHVLGVGV